MLQVNGKNLDFADKNCPYVKRFNDGIRMLKLMTGESIILDWTPNHYVLNPDNKNQRETATGVTIPFRVSLIHNGVRESWQYYTDFRDIGGKQKLLPKNYTFKEALGFNGANPDLELLYYLVFISPYCEKVPRLKEHQNQSAGQAAYKLLLPETEAIDLVEAGKKNAMISNKIYNELSFDDIKIIARTFGLTGVDTMRENQLKIALVRLATADSASMEKFLTNFKINPYVELMADVNYAIEKGIIAIDKRFGKWKWAYRDNNGKFSDSIVGAVIGQNENEQKASLYDFYRMQPSDYEFLRNKLYPSAENTKTEVIQD